MFKKLHLRLAVLCTLITGFIVIVMSVFCLYISERGLTKNEYGSFLTSVNAIYSHLKTETNITTEWLAQTENNGQFTLYIEDNGTPLKYGVLNTDEARAQLIEEVKSTAAKDYHIDISDTRTAKVISKQKEFIFYNHDRKEYYASASYIPKNEGYLGVIAVYSLDHHRSEILNQRLLFLLLDIASIIFLGLFSYFFTKRTLRPIEENRKKQVEFIAAASHELRSPLTVISSSMSAMKKADPVKALRFEEIINLEIKRMSRLVNDMLSLASADNHSWSLKLEDTEMDLLLLNVFEAFQPIAAEKNIRLSIALPDGMLPTCKCDRERMEQVLTILVDNALSYTKSGGRVTLSIKKKPRKIEISVADNGIGISDADKQHIFDRFYRADSSHKSKEHFGLGLCIAYEIVKLHKGTISVSDTPGGGAAFVVVLNV